MIGTFLVKDERTHRLKENLGKVGILVGILSIIKGYIYIAVLPQTRCALLDEAMLQDAFQEHTWWAPNGSLK